MKKFTTLILMMTALFFSITSCRKASHGNKINNVTLNVTVNAGEIYQLDLSQYGDADDLASITQQAANFAVSEITKQATTGNYLYTFSKDGSPKSGGNGNEQVILKIYEPAGRCHHDETNITINFTIL